MKETRFKPNSTANLTLLQNPTINQQIRNRMLFKDIDGTPFSKVYAKQVFAPVNMQEARRTMIGKFEPPKNPEHYDMSNSLSRDQKLLSKSK
jgi:hypothetical protein